MKIIGYWALNYIKIIIIFFQSWIAYPRIKKLQSKDIVGPFRHNKTVLLPLIETLHYKNIQLLIIAKGLQLRGCKVVVIVCARALTACESRPQKINQSYAACLNCSVNLKLVGLFGFETERLSDPRFEDFAPLIKDGLNSVYLSALTDSVNRHYYGDLPTDKNKINLIEKEYLKTLSKVHNAASIIFKKHNPDILLSCMTAYVENIPWVSLATEANNRIAHVSNTQFNQNAQAFNFFHLYLNTERFQLFVSNFGKLNTAEEDTTLSRYLEARVDGRIMSSGFGLNKKVIKQSELKTLFPRLFAPEKKNIVLFPNVLWDVGMSTQNTIFNSVEDWLVQTVRYLEKNEKNNVIIKCHPQERLYTNKSRTASMIITEMFDGVLPKNVILIDHDTKLSSYALFDSMDICCTYNGTIGIEALLAGKKVVVGGKSPYNFLTDASDYLDNQTYFLTFEEKSHAFDKIKIDSIRRFAYFYFLKTSIPWKISKKSNGSSYYAKLELDRFEELETNADPHFSHLIDCILDDSILPESW